MYSKKIPRFSATESMRQIPYRIDIHLSSVQF
jgi:hypothetical protein